MQIYYNTGNSGRQTACEILKTSLESLAPGKIQITVSGVQWADYLLLQQTSKMPLFFLGWAPDYADPDVYVVPFLHTGQYFPNRIAYSNTTLDALLDQQWRELNVTARGNLLRQIQLAAYYDVPYIWEYQGKAYQVMRTWVHGFSENPMTTAGTGNYYYDYWKA